MGILRHQSLRVTEADATEQVEGGLDVVLPDEPVGSLRAGNEVGVDTDVVGTLRDHGGGGAAR